MFRSFVLEVTAFQKYFKLLHLEICIRLKVERANKIWIFWVLAVTLEDTLLEQAPLEVPNQTAPATNGKHYGSKFLVDTGGFNFAKALLFQFITFNG